jgi:D-Tyr-tRNAtyr deacylase
VKSASVTVDSELISSIGKGLLVFAGVGKDDTEKEAENLVNKVLKAKFWPDENGAQVRTLRSAFRIYLLGAFRADSLVVEEERTGY